LCVIALAASPATRPTLLRALFDGGIFTILLIITGLITVVLAFDWLFTVFHRLFFTGETWIFPSSDTLIRLYPEQFWIDAFIFVFGGAMVELRLSASLRGGRCAAGMLPQRILPPKNKGHPAMPLCVV
jgi:integral membrane protein (TIGR01906 family)